MVQTHQKSFLRSWCNFGSVTLQKTELRCSTRNLAQTNILNNNKHFTMEKGNETTNYLDVTNHINYNKIQYNIYTGNKYTPLTCPPEFQVKTKPPFPLKHQTGYANDQIQSCLNLVAFGPFWSIFIKFSHHIQWNFGPSSCLSLLLGHVLFSLVSYFFVHFDQFWSDFVVFSNVW